MLAEISRQFSIKSAKAKADLDIAEQSANLMHSIIGNHLKARAAKIGTNLRRERLEAGETYKGFCFS
jgi:hypothetical protein